MELADKLEEVPLADELEEVPFAALEVPFVAELVEELVAALVEELVECPVKMWDERSTTVTAHEILNQTNVRGKARKAVVDTVAAAVILEGYLDYRRKNKK